MESVAFVEEGVKKRTDYLIIYTNITALFHYTTQKITCDWFKELEIGVLERLELNLPIEKLSIQLSNRRIG